MFLLVDVLIYVVIIAKLPLMSSYFKIIFEKIKKKGDYLNRPLIIILLHRSGIILPNNQSRIFHKILRLKARIQHFVEPENHLKIHSDS